MNFRKYLTEILIVVGISACLAIAYNCYSSKPLALIRTPEKITFAKESELFSSQNSDGTAKEVAGTVPVTEVPIGEINQDSLNKIKQHRLDSLAKIDSAKADINNHQSEYISLTILKKHLNDPRIILIDARPPNLFAAGHIGKAINIYPLQDDDDAYLRSLMKLERSKTIIVYCDGGDCDLSHDVYKDLKNFSYNHVFIYQGGWEEWSKYAGKKQ